MPSRHFCKLVQVGAVGSEALDVGFVVADAQASRNRLNLFDFVVVLAVAAQF